MGNNLKQEKDIMTKVNAWKYGREVYLIGRSHKFRYLTESERTAVIEFITKIVAIRKGIADRLNLKKENVGKSLEKQNSYALLKMVQVIGRNFKVQFPTEEEKTLCDALIEKTAKRNAQGYDNYACDKTTSTEEDSSNEEDTTEEGESNVENGENTENTESTEGKEEVTEEVKEEEVTEE